MSGYELARALLREGGVAMLLKAAKGTETSWLEVKEMSSGPLREGEDKDAHTWDVKKGLIALSNTQGGVLIVGLVDSTWHPVGLGQSGSENPNGFAEDIQARIINSTRLLWYRKWPARSNKGDDQSVVSREGAQVDESLQRLVSIDFESFEGSPVLLLWVQPTLTPIFVWKVSSGGQKAKWFLYRLRGHVGATDPIDMSTEPEKQAAYWAGRQINSAELHAVFERHVPAPRHGAGGGDTYPTLANPRLYLDRSSHWRDIEQRVEAPGHQFFFVLGPPSQWVGLFTARVRDWLSETGACLCQVSAAPRAQCAYPDTVESWEQRLRWALEPQQHENTASALRRILSDTSPFIVFGPDALQPVWRRPAPAALEALIAFLQGRLCEIIREATPEDGSLHHVRIYVALEEAEDLFGTRIATALSQLRKEVSGRFTRLPRVEFPQLAEVVAYSADFLAPDAVDSMYPTVEEAHEAARLGDQDFARFCDNLAALLRENHAT